MVIPFGAGGSTDVLVRIVATRMPQALGQQVVIDNRTGAGGMIGTDLVAKANSDGYTLLGTGSPHAIFPNLYKNVPFHPVNDFSPIMQIASQPYGLVVHPSLGVKSVKELIALAKKEPGKHNYASSGQGGAMHLFQALFVSMAGIDVVHVPYKDSGPVRADLLGGQIQVLFGSLPSTIPLAKQNRVRGIGVTTPKRNNAIPDIPAIAEFVPGYEAVLWYGVWGPKHLPKEITTRWNAEIRKALKQPDMRERLAGEGLDPADSPPERFSEVVKRDVAKWTRVVKAGNIKAGS